MLFQYHTNLQIISLSFLRIMLAMSRQAWFRLSGSFSLSAWVKAENYSDVVSTLRVKQVMVTRYI